MFIAAPLLAAALGAASELPTESDFVPTTFAPLPPLALLQDDQPKWTGSVNVGITFTDGNTERESYSASFNAVKQVDQHRYTVGLGWNKAEENGNETEDNSNATLKYDYFKTETTYLFAAAGGTTDDIANVQLRYNVGGGIGHQFRDDEQLKLSADAGLSYFGEDLEGEGPEEYLAARLGYNLTYVLNENTTFTQVTEAFPSLEDAEDFFSTTDSRMILKVSDRLNTEFQWLLRYDNTPAAGAERVDNRFMVTLGWTF